VVQARLMWTEGRLRFVETPLPEVLRTLGRWYDLDIRLEAPGLNRRSITAEFAAQSPNEVVQALALAIGARVVYSGKIIRFQQ
jgi:ferric-dicitrate binding protein FerR (iron transport regulator)